MKKFKRLLAILIASMMVFALVGCGGDKETNTNPTTEAPTTEAPTTEAPTDAPETPTTDAPADQPTDITLNVHYLREDGTYEGWNVWLWPDGGDGAAYTFGTEADDKGVVATATFPAGSSKIGFIVRLNEWEQKDYGEDQFIEINGVLAGTVDVYVTSGKAGCEIELGDDCVKGLGMYFAEMKGDFKTIRVKFTAEYTDGNTVKILDSEGKEVAMESLVADETDAKFVTITLKDKADEFGKYKIDINGLAFDVEVPDYFSTEEFEDKYAYDGDDLGATWSKDSTTFKVWAPTATTVKLNTYKEGKKGVDDLIKTYDMKAEDKGVWSVTVDGDLNGVYYTYTSDDYEACDPYAKAVGVNGDRAMVIDMESTNPEGWDKDKNPNSGMNSTDANVYEIHFRDISVAESSGIKNAGKYLGLTELGTKNPTGQCTGLSHILDLGITHVQIGPSYDFATVDETKLEEKKQYNWGYDPKNYNVPEGSYSTDPFNGEVRVKEFKEMVQTLHENGVSVIMDVVYNHTYTTNYCYNLIVPGYFFRPGSNGSGCGNDVASERAMVSKFIVDSVVYWAKEYHIDGFRFDLVGLIDTATIRQIREELDKIDPSIILYGEGWTMSTKVTKSTVTMATQTSASKLEGFGFFNDTIRDAIKGSVFNEKEKGYINGDLSKTNTVRDTMMGKVAWSNKGSAQVIYSTCHDNRTLWDEIQLSNPDDSMESKVKQNLMSAAIVYTSQGTPFIFAGEEMLRSKPNGDGTFNHNSYNAGDAVNEMKWDTLNDPTYQTVYNYYKGMIAFRKAHKSFRVPDGAVKYYTQMKDLDKGVIAYELKGVEGEVSDSIFAVYNASTEATTVSLPEGEWTICVQGDKAGTESLGTATGSITVDGITTTILVKGALK